MRSLVIVVMIICIAAGVKAQERWSGYSRGTMTIKPTIGLNLTDFSKNPTGGNANARVGYQIGGSIILGNKIYFEPGIYYMHRSTGYVIAGSPTGTSPENTKLNMGGIRIPAALGVNLLGDESSLFSIHAIAGASAFFVTDFNGDNRSYYKTPTFGVFGGAGVNAGLFFADLSYDWSLTHVQKDFSQIDVGRARSFFYSAGMRLRI